MLHPRGLVPTSLGILIALAMTVRAQDPPFEYKLGNATGSFGDMVSVKLTMDSSQNVQGLQAIFEWDDTGNKLDGVDIIPGSALTSPPGDDGAPPGADVVVRRVGDGYMLLGVVMDNNGNGPEIIPPGENLDIARYEFEIKLFVEEGEPDVVVPFEFVDGKYSADAAGVGPKLENIVVVGGMSIGSGPATCDDCLALPTNGFVRITPTPPAELDIADDAEGVFGQPAEVPVLMKSNNDVQGFVVALRVETKSGMLAATLSNIKPGDDIEAPEFVNYDAFPAANGGALSAIMEYDGIPPFLKIPSGAGIEIANAVVSSAALPEDLREADEAEALRLCEGVGEDYEVLFDNTFQVDPTRTRENLIVIGGSGFAPILTDGALKLRGDPNRPPCKIPPKFEISFGVGSCETVQNPDPEVNNLVPGPIRLSRGPVADPAEFQVGLYYLSPPGALDIQDPDMPQTNDHIQGVSMALKFNQKCFTCDGTYDLTGTITEAVGAEFVNVICENNPTTDTLAPDGACSDDGDSGELIVGILVDALPPFDGADLPPTLDYLKLVCVDFHVNTSETDWDCEMCKDSKFHFPPPLVVPDPGPYGGDDGVDVLDDQCNETPLIRNLASIRTRVVDPSDPTKYITQQRSVKPKQFYSADIAVRDVPEFIRGDCNWSDTGSDDHHTQAGVDISDAAAVVSFLFYDGTWQWMPPCLDACDANDDGRVDLADSVFILRYLFLFGDEPPKPFPNLGVDPTNDRLTCDQAKSCGNGDPNWTPVP